MIKKVCFVTLNNLYLTPYMNKYTNILNVDFDVIYWNRHNLNEEIHAESKYSFNYQVEDNAKKIYKLFGYLRFKSFAKEILKRNDYDFIILLQTSAGVLLNSLILKRYKKRYILDIRDYTFEKNRLFYKFVERLVKFSSISVISSNGYKFFLPPHNYVNVHNDVKIDDASIEKFSLRKNSYDVINISCIGLIRFNDYNKKVILKFKNDQRFRLKFIGKNAKLLENFCVENQVENVELIDRFPPEVTLDYYQDTHIVNNLYGNNTPLLNYALSNKLYYASKLKKPILVCRNTYMEVVSINYGFGYVFDLEDSDACDKLYNYYNSINWIHLSEGCNKFNNFVNNENINFEKNLKKLLI